ncbi:MAG: hypothetical protein KAW56_16820 [Candidatus Marinimicrobia bacterium]|nr:hypothetical protein [Candidatus Neomarinimicrobiota bacterium]
MMEKYLLKQTFKIALLIISLIFLSGCGFVYNLTNFTIPDDENFIKVIESLDTPKKICAYMEDNFEWEFTTFAYDPYTMWLINTKAGDCNDHSTWAIFVAHYHGYEVYQIKVWADYEGYPSWVFHLLGVFVEDGKYNYSSNWRYFPIQVDTFREIVDHHIGTWDVKLYKYKVLDYEMNIIESENI